MAYTTINKPTDYFNTKLYTGTGASASITGVGFQPDWVWIKSRTSADWHILTDAIRGATTEIYTNATNGDNTNVNQLTSFDSDGFSLGGANDTGRSGENFVSWNWLGANGTASNTDGSITSTVSANTTSGFSIVKYTGASNANGATIGHGLGAVPKMIIVKETSASGNNWVTYNSNLGAGKYMALNLTIADQSSSIMWYNTTPTSSVFTVANDSQTNATGSTYIAYCFSEVKGFSKIGSYVGNGNANDGTFVYTGFKPAFVMIKRTDSTSQWCIIDNKRPGYNIAVNTLFANLNSAEATDLGVNLLSNGFKENTTNNLGASGGTYIYMAFAENPLVGTNNIPATAR